MEFGVKTIARGPWAGLPVYEETLVGLAGRTNIVASVVVKDHAGGHLCRSKLQQQFFRLRATLKEETVEVSVLNAKVMHYRHPILELDDHSCVLEFPPRRIQDYTKVAETCSGLGGISTGAKYAGFTTMVQNELQESFCEHQKKHSKIPIVRGDMCRLQTLVDMHAEDPTAACLTWGFSCQPFSKGGDQHQGMDQRSATLPFGLFMAHFLRKEILVMECVAEAASSAFVQRCLEYHMTITKTTKSEIILDLSQLWPSKRRRWWTVISAPFMGKVQLAPLPKVNPTPIWSSLMAGFIELTEEEWAQLKLTPAEYEAFSSYGKGIVDNLVKQSATLDTALHAWGNQIHSCACGCRPGFSSERLRTKGLHGALIHQGHREAGDQLRHISAKELALFVGMPVSDFGDSPQRLMLAGLGQIASPIQAAWVFAHVRRHMVQMQLGDIEDSPPLQVIAGVVRDFFAMRDEWNFGEMTPAMTMFQEAVSTVLGVNLEGKPTEEEPMLALEDGIDDEEFQKAVMLVDDNGTGILGEDDKDDDEQDGDVVREAIVGAVNQVEGQEITDPPVCTDASVVGRGLCAVEITHELVESNPFPGPCGVSWPFHAK